MVCRGDPALDSFKEPLRNCLSLFTSLYSSIQKYSLSILQLTQQGAEVAQYCDKLMNENDVSIDIMYYVLYLLPLCVPSCVSLLFAVLRHWTSLSMYLYLSAILHLYVVCCHFTVVVVPFIILHNYF